MDLFLTILVVAFVVIPQILHDDEKKETVQMTALDFITGMVRFV